MHDVATAYIGYILLTITSDQRKLNYLVEYIAPRLKIVGFRKYC